MTARLVGKWDPSTLPLSTRISRLQEKIAAALRQHTVGGKVDEMIPTEYNIVISILADSINPFTIRGFWGKLNRAFNRYTTGSIEVSGNFVIVSQMT